MKRKMQVLLLVVAVLLLAACGRGAISPQPSEVEAVEPESYAFEAQYIRTNGGGEKTDYPYAVVIRSRAELEAYYEANKDVFDLERKEKVYSDTTIGFLDACDKYDDAWFAERDVVFVVLSEGSGSIRHEVTDVGQNVGDGGWQVTVRSIIPEVCTDDMAQWHIMVEIQMGKVIGEDETVKVAYEGQTTRAEYSYGYANMALELPEGWAYEVKEREENGSSFGIRFWPAEAEEGKIGLYYYPAFGVCGTGLKSEEYIFDSGLKGDMGTYDGGVWSFIVFEDLPGTYVVLNEGSHVWWSEYGGEAMEILGTARLSEGVMGREEAILMAEKQCDIVEHDDVWVDLDIDSGEWTLEFRKRGAAEAAQTVRLAPNGSVIEDQ